MTHELFDALAAPFAPDKVSWRVGSVKKDGSAAMALAYIDARDVMDRLDAVCGPGNWQDRYPHVDKKTVCEIDIYIEGRGWVTKADGAGDSDIEAEKGALSDAFKRAAVRWGIGRYLYHLPSPWVKIDQYKKILPEEMGKLEALLKRDAAPAKPAPSRAAPKAAAGPSTAVTAATAAISMCATSAELKAWWEEHKDRINGLPDPEYLAVSEVMRAKTAELKGVTGRPAPKDDFGLNGDQVPAFN